MRSKTYIILNTINFAIVVAFDKQFVKRTNN